MRVINSENNEVLLANAEIASNVFQRFRGLMFRRSFEQGFGLWLDRCRSIHTLWMTVPIDVYFIADTGAIVEHRRNVKPWSIVIPKERCHAVLEIPNADISIPVGTKISIE